MQTLSVKEVADRRRFYLSVLRGNECQCGEYKRPRWALCYRCWKRLPGDLQRGLYRGIGDGFEEAYEAAIQWLGD